MRYKTREWHFDAFEYDPYGLKPEWWVQMVKDGRAFEYKSIEKPYGAFMDKRSQHKAFTGDWIVRDVFGRVDVYSARNFAQRARENG